MYLALDTNVVIAATVGEPDRLHGAWQAFDAREVRKRFISRAVMEEFEATVEGVGRGEPGIISEMLSDTLNAIRECAPMAPTRVELEASSLRLTEMQIRRVLGLTGVISTTVGEPWDVGRARDALRAFERRFAVQKTAFFSSHPVFEVGDTDLVEELAIRIDRLLPGGGPARQVDCRILAQVGTILRERRLSAEFVTEDRRHMAGVRDPFLTLTRITRIRDLAGATL